MKQRKIKKRWTNLLFKSIVLFQSFLVVALMKASFIGKAQKVNDNDYSGPIVKGWPPGKSRFMGDYIKRDQVSLLSDLRCANLSNVELLILVQTSPGNYERRDDNRRTWMRFLSDYPDTRAFFVMGLEAEPNHEVIDLVYEQNLFCDILQFPYMDTYANVTLDSISAIQFALKWPWPDKTFPKYVVIMDDDTYLHLPRLWNKLFETSPPVVEEIIRWNETGLMGGLFENFTVLRPKENARTTNILHPPLYLYDKDTYPDFLSGSLYIATLSALRCLYEASFDVPIFPINDVYVTGILAQYCNIPRMNLDGMQICELSNMGKAGFDFPHVEIWQKLKIIHVLVHFKWGTPFNTLSDFSFHYVKGVDKHVMHKIMTKQNGDSRPKKEASDWYFITNKILYYCNKKKTCQQVDTDFDGHLV